MTGDGDVTGANDHAGVVDHQVDGAEPFPSLCCCVGDLSQVGEVQTQYFHVGPRVPPQDLDSCRDGSFVVPAREHARRAGAREGRSGLETDPAVGTGDDRDPSPLRGNVQVANHATDATASTRATAFDVFARFGRVLRDGSAVRSSTFIVRPQRDRNAAAPRA